MQGAQKLRSEAHLQVRRNDEVEAQRRRWTFYEAINFENRIAHSVTRPIQKRGKGEISAKKRGGKGMAQPQIAEARIRQKREQRLLWREECPIPRARDSCAKGEIHCFPKQKCFSQQPNWR